MLCWGAWTSQHCGAEGLQCKGEEEQTSSGLTTSVSFRSSYCRAGAGSDSFWSSASAVGSATGSADGRGGAAQG